MQYVTVKVIVILCICIMSLTCIVHSPVIKNRVIKRVHASSQSSSTRISSSVGHRADSHYTSRFRSVTAPFPFRQIGLCSHCPSCSVTFRHGT